MLTSQFPRLRVAHLPTPLEPLDRLSEALGGPRIWIKRDDCTGLATGGNKVRKLEFLLADALAQGADTVITPGAIQSNHVRQTAALSARLGLDCVAVLEDRRQTDEPAFRRSGNVLLDRLFGARIVTVPAGVESGPVMEAEAERLRGMGRRAYVIPTGGSNPLGALGYVEAAREIAEQAAALDLVIDGIVHPTGSAGTQAGLVAGCAALGLMIPVLGTSVGKPREQLEAIVLDMARQTCAVFAPETEVNAEAARVDSDHVGGGYGIPTREMAEAVTFVARTRRHSARPGLYRQGHGRADRYDPGWAARDGAQSRLLAYRRQRRALCLSRSL